MARHLAGLRKARLAELIGMSPASVTGWESGAKRPNRTTVAKLALALRVELDSQVELVVPVELLRVC